MTKLIPFDPARYLINDETIDDNLHEALAPGSKPRFDMVIRALRALDLRLTATHVPRG